MTEIVSIEITHHQLPLDPAFPASWDPQPRTRFPVTIVRVRDSLGNVGIGSGDVMYGFADYERYFIGEDPLDLARHAACLANIEFHAGRPWPLDIALWDLAGKLRGEPIWKMLGGTSPRLRLYASSAVHRPVAEMVATAGAILAEGFDAMKVRFGRSSIADDLAVVTAIRDAFGDRLTLMVDCNQGWRMPWDTTRPWDLDHATTVAAALQAEGVYWMEEPLHRGDYAGMAELRRRIADSTPPGSVALKIAGGEMTREPYEFRELIERQCLDVFQPDAVCSQGISGLAALAPQVTAAGALFTPHTWGNGIGVLANLHLTAGTVGQAGSQWVEFPFDPPEWTVARRDYPLQRHLVHEATDSGAFITLGDGPGLGCELDEAVLTATASSKATFR